MNLKRIASLTAVLALSMAMVTYAIDTKSAKESDKAPSAQKKGCHSTGAKTVGDKAPCSKKCGKSAKTVATTADASPKKGCCSKGAKNAKTVAVKSDRPAKKGCCSKGAKSAKTVADKTPCSKKCGKSDASAKTVAGKSPCSKKCGKSGSGASRIDAVMASLPGMTFRVGDFETACSKSATAKADESKIAMSFVVDGEKYSDRGEATVALAALLDTRATEMSEVQFVAGDETFRCPVSAKAVAEKAKTTVKYRLAGFDFDCDKTAGNVAEKIAKAVSDVQMTYKADGKKVDCPKSCKGKKVTYVVGKDETCCDKSAKLLLAEHKIRTIVETAAAAL